MSVNVNAEKQQRWTGCSGTHVGWTGYRLVTARLPASPSSSGMQLLLFFFWCFHSPSWVPWLRVHTWKDRNPRWILVQIHTCDWKHALQIRLKDFNKSVIFLHHWTWRPWTITEAERGSDLFCLCDPLWSSDLPGSRDLPKRPLVIRDRHYWQLQLLPGLCSLVPVFTRTHGDLFRRDRVILHSCVASTRWKRLKPEQEVDINEIKNLPATMFTSPDANPS